MGTMETVELLTNQIDRLQIELEKTHSQIIAVLMSEKFNTLERLGFDYNQHDKELIFVF